MKKLANSEKNTNFAFYKSKTISSHIKLKYEQHYERTERNKDGEESPGGFCR